MNNQPDPTNDQRPPTDAELEEMLLQMQCGLWSSDEELEALADELDKDPTPLPASLRDSRRALERVRMLLREDAGERDPAAPPAVTRIANSAKNVPERVATGFDWIAGSAMRFVFSGREAMLCRQVAGLGPTSTAAKNETRRWALPPQEAQATGLACVELTRQDLIGGSCYLATLVPVSGAKSPQSVHITLIGGAETRSERTALLMSEPVEIAWSTAWDDLRVELDVEPGAR